MRKSILVVITFFSSTYSLITLKESALIGSFGLIGAASFCYKQNINLNRMDVDEAFFVASAGVVGSIVGYVLYRQTEEYKIRKAEKLVNSIGQKNIKFVEKYGNSTEFKRLIENKKARYSFPLVVEFEVYQDAVATLEDAQELLNCVNKNSIKYKELSQRIEYLLKLFKDAIATLKNDPFWILMYNARTMEKVKNIQARMSRF